MTPAWLTRRSIRRYTAQPVPATTLDTVLTAAGWAPSAHNRQPWRAAVLTAPALKQALAHAMAAALRADRLADGADPAEVEADAARSIARITGAPALILMCLSMADMDSYPDPHRQQAEHHLAVQSVAAATQNLLLAAHTAGLGAAWMCAPLFCPAVVRATLGLPADWEPQALITLGYPANPGKPTPRRPLTAWVKTNPEPP